MRTHIAGADAVACMKGGTEVPSIRGEVRFYQRRGFVFVEGEIFGLPKDNPSGFFGLHIHEGCCCVGENFSETGGHYNPDGRSHPCHAGDLPPLLRCGDGAYFALRTDRFCVKDVIGRTVVIHGAPDDFTSQPAGNSGKKIACGVIC